MRAEFTHTEVKMSRLDAGKNLERCLELLSNSNRHFARAQTSTRHPSSHRDVITNASPEFSSISVKERCKVKDCNYSHAQTVVRVKYSERIGSERECSLGWTKFWGFHLRSPANTLRKRGFLPKARCWLFT